MNPIPQPGSVVKVRSAIWKVLGLTQLKGGDSEVHCRGVSGLVRDKEARFIWRVETGSQVLDPAEVRLEHDSSPGLMDTKLFLEAAFRQTATTTRQPLTFGQAAIDDLSFQHLPVERALSQDRVRLLIADDVGLGKTLEAGLITSELALRGRANRILVVTTRAMLTQFQKEFWTRFSIPLSRLDSAAIRRMRNKIPAHYNVFDQFDRSIVSIDTLKRDAQIRAAIDASYWDLIIIDEAHNAARRKNTAGTNSQRAELAKLLSRRTDSLLLLTATPHDGSHESFASLIEMLDPTRVPDPTKLKREDIEDLVVRRFRSSPEVIEDLGEIVPQRKLVRRDFPLSPEEEAAYQSIADLHLDLDEENKRGRAIDLFRTTLAKAIFSSPAACLETLSNRIRGIEKGTSRGTEEDQERLQTLADQVEKIGVGEFSKYQDLLEALKAAKWTGSKKRDRLVVFSERIATVSWLAERMREDLGLKEDQIARIDGGSVEADIKTQKVIEDFGQENSSIRVLIASDMASEGLNLHFQCHRLIHFDLPWSLLRFQQRNGRIDRYGQDRAPQITYFVGESSHPKVRQMWVLDKLVERDEKAQEGVGDPAVFLGQGDAEGEEVIVAEAVASGVGEDAFARDMDERASQAKALDDAFDAIFGDYADNVEEQTSAASTTEAKPPRLFEDTFSYTGSMLERLGRPEEQVFDTPPSISEAQRIIKFQIPDDMKARDGFGYASAGAVDGRYMPEEAVDRSGKVELTDQADTITRAIDEAKMRERSWPDVQYLWDGHPILEWFADRSNTFFPQHSAPIASLKGRLADGEIAFVMHGAVPNSLGAPVVDRWAVVVRSADGELWIEEIAEFLSRTQLNRNTPSQPISRQEDAQNALRSAVDCFQTHLRQLRNQKAQDIEAEMNSVLARLSDLEKRHKAQLGFDLGEITFNEGALTTTQKRAQTLRQNKEKRIDRLFEDWIEWFERTRKVIDDPNPHVDLKAVFVG
nr:DEAD/DEAH box helicase [uncultured Ruegeria sp.]